MCSENCSKWVIPHIYTAVYIQDIADIYNVTTLCLNWTLPCVDFMDVIMGDIPVTLGKEPDKKHTTLCTVHNYLYLYTLYS